MIGKNSRNTRSRRQNRQGNGSGRINKVPDRALLPHKLRVQNRIPQHTPAPGVQRIIRLRATIAANLFSITPAILSAQDQVDYGSSAARYSFVRVEWARAWYMATDSMESVVQITDLTTMFSVTSEASLGAYNAAVGLAFGLNLRQTVYATSATTPIIRVGLGQEAAGEVIIDVLCYFN
jgi:hypothetical protein